MAHCSHGYLWTHDVEVGALLGLHCLLSSSFSDPRVSTRGIASLHNFKFMASGSLYRLTFRFFIKPIYTVRKQKYQTPPTIPRTSSSQISNNSQYPQDVFFFSRALWLSFSFSLYCRRSCDQGSKVNQGIHHFGLSVFPNWLIPYSHKTEDACRLRHHNTRSLFSKFLTISASLEEGLL